MQKGDLIVVVARTSVLKIIYNRIRHIDSLIPIYNIFGERLADRFAHQPDSYPKTPLYEEVVSAIEKCGTISFDIFDTLIMRKTLFPDDVFDIVAKRAQDVGIKCPDFKLLRKEAERIADSMIEAPNIDQIYNALTDISEIGNQEADVIKSIEYDVETSVICPRSDMCSILEAAYKNNKKVILISDMYFSGEVIAEWLKMIGIQNYHRLYVSSDYHKSKSSGRLFQLVKEEYDVSLHIGDNQQADIDMAKSCGINPIRIFNAYEMMINSPLHKLLLHTNTLNDRLWIGRFATDALNSPFALCGDGSNKLQINTPEQLARYCFYPIINGFISYLISETACLSRSAAIILFSARDGFFVQKLFDIVAEDEKDRFPESEYLYVSRRAITVANLTDEKDILAQVNRLHMTATLGEILYLHFGVEAKEDDPDRCKMVSSTEGRDEIASYIMTYKDTILENAEEESQCYRDYIKRLDIKDNVYLFDLACTGTVPHGLSKLLGKEIKLICFSTFNIPNEYYESDKDILSYLGNCNEYDSGMTFFRYYKLFEILFAPNEGSLIRIDKTGRPLLGEKIPESIYQTIQRMQDEIMFMFRQEWNGDNNAMFDEKGLHPCTVQLADRFLQLIESEYSKIPLRVKESFLYDDSSVNDMLHVIWDEVVS